MKRKYGYYKYLRSVGVRTILGDSYSLGIHQMPVGSFHPTSSTAGSIVHTVNQMLFTILNLKKKKVCLSVFRINTVIFEKYLAHSDSYNIPQKFQFITMSLAVGKLDRVEGRECPATATLNTNVAQQNNTV